MGLGFLCKGPVVFLVAWLTLIGYLACTKSVRRGARALVDWRAGAITLLLVASWPVPVAIVDPNAVRVWLLEMGQKTGASGIAHHSDREMFATSWFWMTLPWSLIGTAGLLLPLWRRDRADRPAVWFPWWWTVGSFVMFGTWSVAKPNYYLPCLPGVALLCGMQWLRLVRFARGGVSSDGKTAARSAQLLRAHWVALGVTAVVGPGYLIWRDPGAATWAIGVSLLAFMGVVGSVWFWRRGRDVWSFGCQAAALGAIVLLGYGSIAPRLNGINGHHDLAKRLEALTEAHSELMFFREIDEGLWFYLRDRTLVAVPNSQPRYNKDLDLMDDLKSKRYVIDWQADKQTQREQLTRQRAISDRDVLFEWLRGGRMGSGYVLMRARSYDQFMELEGGLGGRLAPVFRETGMDRTELVLLRVEPGTASASVEGQGASRR
jgi:4-amino-4-deoxy-L-arabinose transferase-like glycosyltransferase